MWHRWTTLRHAASHWTTSGIAARTHTLAVSRSLAVRRCMNHTAATSAAPSTAAGTRALATAATAAATTSTKRPLSPKTAALEASATGKRAHLDGIDVPSLAHARSISSSSTAASASPLDIDMSSAPVSQETPQLVLTPLEQSIFGHVLACCAMFKLETQVRVAGGWVRDKLLGLESEDIDFALDNCTGEEFAGKLSEYLKSIGEKTSSIGVIKVNPDQSKHLATATMKVLDMSIDINNFREEIYHPGSRIPEITLSTAKEDALRRDFTINALFYNIHTKQVEDYVDGLTDLRAGLLRTPRDPFKTFSDDPLRILRAARFAGRFGYKVHESITAAARTASIQADLSTKVSRERFGLEVGKMLTMYRTACGAFRMLAEEWRLRRIVFEPPPTFEACPPVEIGEMQLCEIEKKGAAEDDAKLTEMCLKGMAQAQEYIQEHPNEFTPEEASALLLSAFLIPYHGWRTEIKKGRFQPLVWWIVRESLRLPQRDSQLASDLLLHAHQLVKASFLHHEILTAGPSAPAAAAAASSSSSQHTPSQRLTLVTGGILKLTGPHSRVAMRLARLLLAVHPEDVQLSTTATFDIGLNLIYKQARIPRDAVATRLEAYIEWIEKQSRLLELPVWEMKPIASGTEVCSVLGISAKGPHVGAIINRMMDWQVLHIDQLIPLYTSSASSAAPPAAAASSDPSAMSDGAPAAASSSSAASSSAHPGPSPAALAPVKEACFAWLKTQNLSVEPPQKTKQKQ